MDLVHNWVTDMLRNPAAVFNTMPQSSVSDGEISKRRLAWLSKPRKRYTKQRNQGNSKSIKTYIFFNPYPWMAFDPLDYARFPRSGVVPVSNFSGLSGLLQSL